MNPKISPAIRATPPIEAPIAAEAPVERPLWLTADFVGDVVELEEVAEEEGRDVVLEVLVLADIEAGS